MIAIRLDANEQVGSGHLQRCLPLAEEWRRQGRRVVFFCRPGTFIKEKLTQHDFPFVHIPALPLEDEARWVANAIDTACIVLVDGYCYSDAYLETLCGPGRLVCAYDDDALYTYNCDVVINPHPFARKLPIKTGCRKPGLLLGSQYWVLRQEFECATPIEIRDNVSSILVLMGAGDVNNYISVVLEALDGLPVEVHVVLGALTQHDTALSTVASSRPWLHLHKTPASVAALMQQCDMAISAGGNTLYELSVIGVPTIAIPQVHNEEIKVGFLKEDGVVISPGNYQEVGVEALREATQYLIQNSTIRFALAEKARALMPHSGGANRLVKALGRCMAIRTK